MDGSLSYVSLLYGVIATSLSRNPATRWKSSALTAQIIPAPRRIPVWIKKLFRSADFWRFVTCDDAALMSEAVRWNLGRQAPLFVTIFSALRSCY